MMSHTAEQTLTETRRLKAGWVQFLQTFPPDYDLFAVTLAFNNRISGTVLPCRSLVGQSSNVAAGINGKVSHRLAGYRWMAPEDVSGAVRKVWFATNKMLWQASYLKRQKPVCIYRGFIENETSNVHAHLAWAVPPTDPREALPAALARCWTQIEPSGTTRIEAMTDPQGWGEYLIKKVFTLDWSDRSGVIPRPDDAAEMFLSSLPNS